MLRDWFQQRRAILMTLGYAAAASSCGGGSRQIPPPAAERFRVSLVLSTAGEPALVPVAIADTGAIAGYQADDEWGFDAVAVRVESGQVTALSASLQLRSFAMAVSAQGSIVVGEHGWQPHAWTAAGGNVLSVPTDYFSGRALAVNASGRIVGSWADYDDPIPPNPVGPRPCTWASVNSYVQPLATVDANHPLGSAFDINAAGVIIGTVETDAGFAAARWSNAGAAVETFAHLPGGQLSEARAVNNVGEIVGRTGVPSEPIGESRAFVLRAGSTTLERLPSLTAPSPYAEALDINDAGTIVGHSANANQERHAVMWRNGEIVDLNSRVDNLDSRIAYLDNAVAITSTGVIAALARLSPSQAPRVLAIALLSPES